MIIQRYKGYALGILSSASFGLIPLFSLPVLATGMPHDTLVFWRFVLSAILLGSYLLLRGISLNLRLCYLPSMLLLGVLYILSAVLLFRGYALMPSGVATVLHYMYPFFVSLSLWIGWREHISLISLISMVLAILGVVLLMGGGQGGTIEIEPWAIAIVLASGLAYALYIVTLRHSRSRELSSVQLSFWMLVIAGIGCGVNAVIMHGGITFPEEANQWMNIFGLALIPTVLSNLCLILAVQHIGALSTAILGAMEPLTAVVIGVMCFDENLSLLGIIGVCAIIGAVLLSILSSTLEKYLLRISKGTKSLFL